ncbi:MAG: hypothetical protein J5621_09580 [Paludibacteraceae bacterium]|nr:hypothetical protein [Paludibacteraceae bacterium]
MKRLVIIFAIFCLLAVSAYAVVSIRETTRMEKDGGMLIQNIEAFYAEHGRLPDNSELSGSENEHGTGPFYEKTSDLTYSIYFCMGFDSYYKYDSDNKEWYYFPYQTKIQTMIQRIRN